MKKLTKSTILLLLSLSVLCTPSALKAQEEPTPGSLEKALLRYVLSYEAYKEAKYSDKLEVRSQLPSYLKDYREAYANYLELLRQADLYQPDKKPMDPANDFNKNREKKGRQTVLWSAMNSQKERERIKNAVRLGKSFNSIVNDLENTVSTSQTTSTDMEDEDDYSGFNTNNQDGVVTNSNNPRDAYERPVNPGPMRNRNHYRTRK